LHASSSPELGFAEEDALVPLGVLELLLLLVLLFWVQPLKPKHASSVSCSAPIENQDFDNNASRTFKFPPHRK
jgi:hypothetical protein